jgi:hypothetical protein
MKLRRSTNRRLEIRMQASLLGEVWALAIDTGQLARRAYHMETQNSLVEHMLDMLDALLRDVACFYSYKHFNRDSNYVRARTAREGLQFLTVALPSLGKSLDYALGKKQSFRVNGFKKAKDRTTPEFLGWLFEGVLDAEGVELPDACPDRVRHIRQLTYYFYKSDLPYAEHLNDNVINQFIETEKALESVDLESIPSEILDTATNVIANICSGVESARFIPRHGPGSVSTGERHWYKMRFSRFYTNLDKVFPYGENFFSGCLDLCDNYHILQGICSSAPGIAKVILVPKDSRGPRLISCEPLEYQYLQQGIARELVRVIECASYSRGRVNFSDQTINQRYARWGSMGAKWVTLDMKDASDRVSVALVQRLFAKTHVLEYLLASRSESTRLPNGDLVHMHKFAPMGSALCFPVEALVFWALAVSCIVYANGDNTHLSQKLSRAMSTTRVYGDDLILHTEDYGVVMQYFPSVGLMFNEKKCCTSGSFRESCGFDAYKGRKVTPIRYRNVWDARNLSTNQLISSVELSNELYRQGYWESADLLMTLIVRSYGDIVPIIEHDWPESFICFRRLTASIYDTGKAKRKFSKPLQGVLVRAPVVMSPSFIRRLSGYEKLRWALIKPSEPIDSLDNRCLRKFARTFQASSASAVDRFPVRNRVTHKLRWCLTTGI